MKHSITLLVGGLVSAAAITVGGLGLADLATADPGRAGSRPVIVEVTGDAANGFGIEYTDGSGLYPPTDSEALAECAEYDARVARVRCRAQFRTWYRDLAELQRSLEYLQLHH
ncbi:hypothetical protein BH11ACT8_BH11ACT8_14510 [soil metagenome]